MSQTKVGLNLTKSILFLTGTRADYGKLKPLISIVESLEEFDLNIFVTGMHTLSRYGSTYMEIEEDGFSDYLYVLINQIYDESMDLILANTIIGLSRYVHENPVDMIIIHGDRLESLAGAIVGSFRNILVCHIEGGERSGTLDELLRHAITKLSHKHLVANAEAAKRVRQLGENPSSIHEIGSPETDAMLSESLPSIEEVKKRYEIKFKKYSILIFHPVTTESKQFYNVVQNLVNAVIKSNLNYVVIYPNNDEGSGVILNSYKNKFKDNPNFKLFPSMRFEYYLTLLKNSNFIIGNSSSGIREAPFYGVKTVNIGTRQSNRYSYQSIINTSYIEEEIINAINKVNNSGKSEKSRHFGFGNSAEQFAKLITDEQFWEVDIQKQFHDLD
tara:strand:+ start:1313 stop:2473 length:1161 start_codon:yes stop_codon:yes gene_type:complete